MPWFYFVIIGLVIVYRIIKASNAAKAKRPPASTSRPSISQRSNSQPSPLRQLIDNVLNEGNPRTSPPPVPNRSRTASRQPAPKPENHFSEERLIDEYYRTRNKGTTIEHHTHDYFDEEEDASKSPSLEARKVVHPLAKALREKDGLKNAVLLSEILQRKY